MRAAFDVSFYNCIIIGIGSVEPLPLQFQKDLAYNAATGQSA